MSPVSRLHPFFYLLLNASLVSHEFGDKATEADHYVLALSSITDPHILFSSQGTSVQGSQPGGWTWTFSDFGAS